MCNFVLKCSKKLKCLNVLWGWPCWLPNVPCWFTAQPSSLSTGSKLVSGQEKKRASGRFWQICRRLILWERTLKGKKCKQHIVTGITLTGTEILKHWSNSVQCVLFLLKICLRNHKLKLIKVNTVFIFVSIKTKRKCASAHFFCIF